MMFTAISDSWALIFGIFGLVLSTSCFISYHIGKLDGRKKPISREVKE